ncbi:MAG: LysM peptidoglycan-binding domain-containing protein [Treponema sp.]|nr:LysM peptidoglycan-binding domain-containing protein [Treponema sp.]
MNLKTAGGVFLFFAGTLFLQAENAGSGGAPLTPVQDGRPLRGVQAEPPATFPVRPSSFTPAPSPLSAPEALEQPLVKRYIAEYSSPGGIAWLNAVLKNSGLYLPFIREAIARRNLPPELLYLPVIESGFLASAKSKSGAVGIWQFMLNSIAPFDMKVNEFVDERRDFRKSTIGALKKLEDNHRVLGNWPLALAAYNTGLGGISRVVQKTGIRDYWLLCEKKELRTETIHYVPKLLAVAHILSRPRRFGVDYWPEALAWTEIPVKRQASLDVIAAETGIDRNLLRRLNMELLQGITPPDNNYALKVPAEEAARITALLERDDIKLLRYYRYVVRYGDTLSSLSRHYGVSLGLIEQHNPGILNRYLKTGETIIIPALAAAAPYQGRAASGPASFDGSYIVKRGDTFWSLALLYGIDPQTLAQENGMELNQILHEGKTLKVPILRE